MSRKNSERSANSLVRSRFSSRPLNEVPSQPIAIQIDCIPKQFNDDAIFAAKSKAGDSEKIAIDLRNVDLGHMDLSVQDGFCSHRTDFIGTAIRHQLERHVAAVKQSVAREKVGLGLSHDSRQELEAVKAAGEPLDVQVVKLATIAADATPKSAQGTIASVHVLEALHASAAVRAALSDRTT